jgi:hypothetical protein
MGDPRLAPSVLWNLQGYLAHKKPHPALGTLEGPRHSPPVGSYGNAVSYGQGNPVRTRVLPDIWIVWFRRYPLRDERFVCSPLVLLNRN